MIRRGVDTNILVYAHVAALPQHARVLAFLLEQLREEEVTLVVTPAVLHEFVHIVTDSRRFEEPATMDQALNIARGYLRHSNVLCVGPDANTVRSAFDFSERKGTGSAAAGSQIRCSRQR